MSVKEDLLLGLHHVMEGTGRLVELAVEIGDDELAASIAIGGLRAARLLGLYEKGPNLDSAKEVTNAV